MRPLPWLPLPWLVVPALLAGCSHSSVGAADAADPGAADVSANRPDIGDATPSLDAGLDSAADGSPQDDMAGMADAAEGDAPPDAAAPDVAHPDAAVPDAAPRCAPVECAAVEITVAEHHMRRVDPCAFSLRLEGDVAQARRWADALADRAGGYVALGDINLNRETRRGITAGAADRLRNHDFVGYRWNDGDMDTAQWYPQGMSGGRDAGLGARWHLVSWYDNQDDGLEKGARLSLVNPDWTRYRLMLLVVPTADGLGPALYDSGGSLHAGGIVWIGDLLYVADTVVGMQVFDLSRVIATPDSDDTSRMGVFDGEVHAFGYRYVVPRIARYRLAPDSCRVRFSFIGLDRSGDVPALVTGEYRRDDHNGRIVRWPLDPATGWLAEEDGVVHAVDAVVAGQTRMQGGTTWQGDWYISSSSQVGANLGRLYRNRPGEESRITAWPYGCEDLYYEPEEDLIWTATEHPGAREVVGIPLVRP